MTKDKPLSERKHYHSNYECCFLDEDVQQTFTEILQEIESQLRKLGVRINKKDNFDLIGVENAIYIVKEIIKSKFGEGIEK